MTGKGAGRAPRRWDARRTRYRCADGRELLLADTAGASLLDYTPRKGKDTESRTAPRCVATVSGMRLTRDTSGIIRGAEGARTIVFPKPVRRVEDDAFQYAQSLRQAVLNGGLEELGADGSPDDLRYQGVFEKSAVGELRLPSTLRQIGYAAFRFCTDLKRADLPDGLARLGGQCFAHSGIEAVRIPDSVVEVTEKAFYACRALRSVALGEGSRLEKIGHDAFGATGLEPSALGPVSRATF